MIFLQFRKEKQKGKQKMKKLIIKSMAVASIALIAGCGQVDSGEVGFFTEWTVRTAKLRTPK